MVAYDEKYKDRPDEFYEESDEEYEARMKEIEEDEELHRLYEE